MYLKVWQLLDDLEQLVFVHLRRATSESRVVLLGQLNERDLLRVCAQEQSSDFVHH